MSSINSEKWVSTSTTSDGTQWREQGEVALQMNAEENARLLLQMKQWEDAQSESAVVRAGPWHMAGGYALSLWDP